MYDLLLKGGHLVDPSNAREEITDIAFADGKVAAIDSTIHASEAKQVRDVTGLVVTPGLIDLHTHVYWGGTSIGVDPVSYAAQSGTTTLVDAGTAGPGNFTGFRAHVIEVSAPRILAFLNISFAGIYAFSKEVMVGECGDFRLLHPEVCLQVAEENRDLIVGIKVRVGMAASDGRGVAPLDVALEVADELGLPVMCHLDNPPPSRMEVVSRLRPGDVMTHCFRPWPGAPARARDGFVREEIVAARERGVLFDIGHGAGSFGFVTAEAMLAAGFQPDCISSDIHVMSIDGPVYNQLVTLSKFLALGMPLADVIEASTAGPAKAIGRPELGTLALGTPADVTIMRVVDGHFEFEDCQGLIRHGSRSLALHGMVLGGQWWNQAAPTTE